jgi:putative flippase GtrA
MKATIKDKEQKMRFVAVGGVNTVIDFGLLFILKSLGLPAISANLISTTTAFCFSFFANKKYTFKTTETNIKREVFLFVVVTLFGLWVLQTIVIAVVTMLLSGVHLSSNAILFIAKVIATMVSLVWNYVLYSRVVFKKKDAELEL